MNAAALSTLADPNSSLAGQDDDAHVEAFEEWDQRCMCCCCTGECRDHDYDLSFEGTLFEGFVEGDLEGSDLSVMW